MTSWADFAADFLESDADTGPREPLPHQQPPDFDDPSWRYFVLAGGRGSGKTEAGSRALDAYMTSHPRSRGRIIAPTLGDARESCVKGPSGVLAINPDVRFTASPEAVLRWPNGSRARLFGAYRREDVERLRAGGNSHIDWYEELAAWHELDDAWDQARFGLRGGLEPKTIVTTTPKPWPRYLWLTGEPQEGYPDCPPILLRHATIDDNPFLPPSTRQELYDTYGGTQLGEQELYGRVVRDVRGALWKQREIDADRLTVKAFLERIERGELRILRVVVAVDPPGGRTEAGILAVAKGDDRRGYVIEDASLRGGPDLWVPALVSLYDRREANLIVAEINYGGDMVEYTIQSEQRGAGRRILPVKVIHASRGKAVRAEPVANLYRKHLMVHVGNFPKLEGEQTTWVPDEGRPSPNRMDAVVWAATELFGLYNDTEKKSARMPRGAEKLVPVSAAGGWSSRDSGRIALPPATSTGGNGRRRR